MRPYGAPTVMHRSPSVFALLLLIACSDDRSPSSPPPANNGGQTISGRERFGWTQTAPTRDEFGLYRFAMYVDGARRVVVTGETCNPTGATSYDCSAPLPPLSAGVHTLELAVFVEFGPDVIESARSAPLRVTVAGATAPADETPAGSARFSTSDGVPLRADVLTRDLVDPIDLAAAPDGRLFVAERGGRLRLFDATGAERPGDDALRHAARDAGAEIASIAIAPDFARTGAIFVAYLAGDGDGAVLRIARLREHEGRLAQAAVLASHEVAAGAGAVMRFAPDGGLYVGIGSGDDPDTAQQLAASSGKILRLTGEGGTPPDNPWKSPVFSAGHREPRGLAWHPQTGALWSVEPGEPSRTPDELNAVLPGANYGWPVANGDVRHPRVTPPALLLPAGTEPSGLAAIADETSPWFGDLLVAGRGANDVFRVRVDASGAAHVAGRLLRERFGPIGQIAASAGTLHVITSHGDMPGAGREALIRIVPETPGQALRLQ